MLTPKQKQVLEWIESYLEKQGTMPSRREIADGLGLSSPATIQQHIEALEKKGFLKRNQPNESRALQWTSKSKKLFNASAASKTNLPHSIANESGGGVSSSLFELPLLGSIAAGNPIEVYQQSKTIEVPLTLFMSESEISKRAPNLYVLKVRGDSMIEDGILQDDLVILEKLTQSSLSAGSVKNGQTVAALLNGEATLKRFYKKNLNQIAKQSARQERNESDDLNAPVIAELHPANPNYPVIPIKSDDRFEIQGVMVGLFRRYI
jgi:repressor LexA